MKPFIELLNHRAIRTALLVVCASCLFPGVIVGGEYEEIVSSNNFDLYKIDNKNILIRTENCLEDVQARQVLLTMNGRSGQIEFSESENSCRVTAVYGTSGYRVGNYMLNVDREKMNWYKITDQDIYIRTADCLIFAANQEAVLSISTIGKGGSGSLHVAGEACRVIGLYAPMFL